MNNVVHIHSHSCCSGKPTCPELKPFFFLYVFWNAHARYVFCFFYKFMQIIDIGELLTKEDANERKKCVLTKNRFFPH